MAIETRLLDYLKQHDGVSTLQIAKDLNISSPSKAISNLRKLGVDVVSERRQGINREGKKIFWNVYKIGGRHGKS